MVITGNIHSIKDTIIEAEEEGNRSLVVAITITSIWKLLNYSKPWKTDKQLNSKERNNSDYKDELNAISHKTGDVTRCSICDSKKHFRADCQHNPKKKDSSSGMVENQTKLTMTTVRQCC